MKEADAATGISSSGVVRVLAIAAVAAAMILAVTLAVRPISSYDVGYHLAYGEHFLDTDEIVQTNRFVYTRLRSDILDDPANLGPGCRYDAETNTYHFVNANWLSQVVMAVACRAGGMTGLGILQAALIAAIFLTMAATMRRGGVAWHWIAPAIILIALAAYERFNLRPEVFGYLILVLQWWLIVGFDVAVPATAKRARWRLAGVIALQILAVNLHSYFILGVALVGAMFADALLRRLWARLVTHSREKDPTGRLKWLGIATAGVVFACLVNPFFFRGAIMPVQTLLFIGKHNIAGGAPQAGQIHPWATIGEFFTPFAEGVRHTRVIAAYYVVLCLTGVAGVVALLRRRWGWLLVLVGMMVISTRMRRNIAPAAMIIVPLAMIILTDGWNWIKGYFKRGGSGDPPRRKWVGAAVAIITLVLAGWWTVSVVSNRFYFSERRAWRCGWGVSEMTVPLGPAKWIDTNKPAGKVFCGYDCSSNLMYFTRPHRQVPVLTNTWAYPPYVMQWVIQCTAGHRRFEPVVAEYDVGAVVLGSSAGTAPLIKALSASPDWAVVHVGVSHVVFLRRTGPNAALAKDCGVTGEDFDAAGHIERVSRTDPVPAFALHNAAVLLDNMAWGDKKIGGGDAEHPDVPALLYEVGWADHAVAVWGRCIELEPSYYEAAGRLGRTLAMRGTAKLLLAETHRRKGEIARANRIGNEGLADWNEAERRFKDAIRINPDYEDALGNLRLLRHQIAAFKRRIIVVPQMQ